MNKQVFDFGDISPVNYFISISVVLALLFSMVDGNTDASYLTHLFRWICQSLLPMALMVTSYKALATLRVFNRLNPWVKLVVSGLVGALGFVPFALSLDFLLGTEAFPSNTDGLLVALADEISGVVPPVVLCWLAINAPWLYGFKIINPQKTAPALSSRTLELQPQNSMAELLNLLPVDKRGEILYLKSELHYLTVVTTAGQALILCNLKDAIAACPQSAGIQPHRSFWVSEKAILDFRKKGREGLLLLKNNTEIPVSRNKISEVRQLLEARRLSN